MSYKLLTPVSLLLYLFINAKKAKYYFTENKIYVVESKSFHNLILSFICLRFKLKLT